MHYSGPLTATFITLHIIVTVTTIQVSSSLISPQPECICYLRSSIPYGQNDIFCRNKGTVPESHIVYTGKKIIQSEKFQCTSKQLYAFNLEIEGIEGELGKSLQVSKTIVSVKLNGNALSVLTQPHFNSLRNLQNLDLHNNRIHEITQVLFRGPLALRYLDVENNKLRQITTSTFGSLAPHGGGSTENKCNVRSLLYLYLGNNEITSVEPNSFDCMPSLKILELKKNNIRLLPDNVFKGLQSLRTLKLYGNKLDTIEENAFADCCTELTTLDVVDNQLSYLPPNVFRSLPKLTSLHLDRNKFVHITTNLFSHVHSRPAHSRLITLNMKRNHLVQIRANDLHGDHTPVSSINLYDNSIQRIEDFSFQRMDKLKNLVLQKNEISVISRNTFIGLKSLNYLVITDNRIEQIEDGSFIHLSKLDTLSLEANRIWRLTKKTFKGLNNTFSLSLGSNLIEDLEANIFLTMYSLKYLYLEKNRITIVKNYHFNGLLLLKKLDLSDNPIHTVDPHAFKDLRSLLFLDLSGNKLKSICTNIFYGLRSLHSLILSKNRLSYIDSNAYKDLHQLNMLNLKKNMLTEFTAGYYHNQHILSRLGYLDMTDNHIQLNDCTLCGLDRLTTLLMDTANSGNHTLIRPLKGLTQRPDLQVIVNGNMVVTAKMHIQPCSPDEKKQCRNQAASTEHQRKLQACLVKLDSNGNQILLRSNDQTKHLHQVLIYVSVPVAAMTIIVTVVVVAFYLVFRRKKSPIPHNQLPLERAYELDSNLLDMQRSPTSSDIPKYNNNVYGNLL